MSKHLKTLQKWNDARFDIHAAAVRRNVPNGIACPKCGEELLDVNPNVRSTSWPPKTRVACKACSWQGRRVV